MSLAVPIEQLRAAIAERGGAAYLLTVSGDGRPHAVHVAVRWDGDVLIADVGKRSAANAAERSIVSLLYPIRAADDYSLIIDATAAVASNDDAPRLRITPTKAVLHRPAAAPDLSSSCDSDCVPLLKSTDR